MTDTHTVLIKSDHFDTSDRTWFCLFTSHNKEQHILQITPVLFLLTSPMGRDVISKQCEDRLILHANKQ